MAEEKLQYTLTLATRATGTGVQETTAALAKLKAASADVPMVKLGSAVNGVQSDLKKTGFVANQVSMQVGDFFQQVTGGTSALRAFSQQAPQLIGTFTSMGKMAGPVGIGLMAVAALLPILVQGFQALAASFEPVKEKAEDTEKRITAMAEALGKVSSTTLDDLEAGLTHDLELTDAIKQSWNETEKAQASYATTAMENATELRNIEQGIWQLLGGQIDKRKELAIIAAEEAAKRRLAFEQVVKAEQDLKVKADEAAADAAEKLKIKQQIKYETEIQLIKDKEELDILQRQSNELKRIAEGKGHINKLPDSGPLQKFADETANTFGASYGGTQYKIREKAGEMAKDPYFLAKLEGVQKQVDSMEAALESLGGPGGTVARAEVAFQKAKTNAEDVAKAAEISAAELEASFKKDEIKARFETVKKSAEQQANDITAILSQIESTSAQDKAAKQTILKATADGKVTADESVEIANSIKAMTAQGAVAKKILDAANADGKVTAAEYLKIAESIKVTNAQGEAAKQILLTAASDGKIAADEAAKVADSMRVIAAQVQAGLMVTSGNTNELIALTRSVAEQAGRDNREIQTLKQQVSILFQRTN